MSKPSEMTLGVRTVKTAELDAAASASDLEEAVKELKAEGLNVRFETERDNIVEPVTATLVVVGVVAGGKFVIRVIREAKGQWHLVKQEPASARRQSWSAESAGRSRRVFGFCIGLRAAWSCARSGGRGARARDCGRR
jgi:hypothetical protein